MKEQLFDIFLKFIHYILVSGNTVRRVAQLPMVKDLFHGSPRLAIDIGAGGGIYSCGMYTFGYLAFMSKAVFPLDPEIRFCQIIKAKANRKKLNHIHPIRSRGEFLPLRNECADLVLCTEVLTYMQNDLAGIEEIARILRSKGKAIISIPLPPEPAPVVGALREGYTAEQLLQLLNHAGLKIEKQRTCMFGISRFVLRADYPFWHAMSRKAHLPILFLVYIERFLNRLGFQWGKPYCFMVLAGKS